ncbi:MAG: hypothetical protein ACRD3S_11065, partial [Terracidiphilus sp.]
YFMCPDCRASFRWNKELNRLVVAQGPSKKRHVGRRPGMTPERRTKAERLETLIGQFGGKRGSIKKAVQQFGKEFYPNMDFYTVNELARKMRQDLHRSPKVGSK